MNVKEFQAKLTEVMSLAIKKDKKLNQEEIRMIFSENNLDETQIQLVYEYLQSQGVKIEGVEQANNQTEEVEEEQADPLSREEEEYLEEYKASIEMRDLQEEEKQNLWRLLSEGDLAVANTLSQFYYEELLNLCVKRHRKEIFIGDMIQDANLRLLLLLGEGKIKEEKELRSHFEQMMREIVRENDQVRFADDCLVAKVRNLESAVRELTDGEEAEENKYSIEELSVFLDMGVEEIQDILRLTGDEK